MKTVFNSLRAVLGLVMLVALALGLVWLFGTVKEGPPVGQQVSPIETPTPLRATPTIPGSSTLIPLPTDIRPAPPTPIPGTPIPFPTFTPAPTWTPVPGAAESILYQRKDPEGPAVYRLPVDAAGRVVAPAARIPDSLGQAGPLYPSPDGRYVAIIHGVETGHVISILQVASGQIIPLIRDGFGIPGKFLNWHPNSREVLYATSNGEPGFWIVDVHSGRHKRISKLEPDSAAVSPDGTKIIFSSWKGFGASGEMWTVNVDGTKPRLLFTSTGAMFGLAWSPDGTKVAYVGCSNESKPRGIGSGVCVMDANGQNRGDLGSNFNVGYGFLPIWSPNSRKIAFVARESPEEKPDPSNPPDWDEWVFRGANIHLVDVNTGEERHLLSDSLEGNIDPTWSPDGSMIAFASTRSGTAAIWVVNTDGSELRQLTSDGQLSRYPIWLRR